MATQLTPIGLQACSSVISVLFMVVLITRNNGPIVAEFCAHWSVAVVVAAFVRSRMIADDCDHLWIIALPQMA